MVEAIFAMVIVGGMLVAALSSAAAAKTSQARLAARRQARLLADDLAAEINAMPFQEPGSVGLWPIGPGSGETGPDRSGFDDADDYHGWSACPPQQKDGTVLPWAAAFRRRVTVDWGHSSLPRRIVSWSTGIKVFHVRVDWRGVELVDLMWVRTTTEYTAAEMRAEGM